MNLYVFLSALDTLQYVPIVISSCNYIFIQKKKKKKKRKMTRTSVWVKIPKLCHNTLLSIFSLGKGRESLRLKPYIKLITSALSDLPPACNDLDKASTTHLKLPKTCLFFTRISHLSSNRRERNLAHLFPVYDPSKKAHPQHKICAFLDAERHKFQEHHNYSSPWARESPK